MRKNRIKEILYQLIYKDEWRVVEQIDGWIFVYERMPLKMRICVDLRMDGHSIDRIAKTLKVHKETARRQLNRAKKRFAQVLL